MLEDSNRLNVYTSPSVVGSNIDIVIVKVQLFVSTHSLIKGQG